MQSASISTLKARLSEYLRIVRSGEEVIITDRGAPIARLTPLESGVRQDAHVQELIEAGLVRPAERPLPADFWDHPRPEDPTGLSLESLLRDRDQNW